MSLLNLAFLACLCWLSSSPGNASQNCHPNDLSALKELASQLINGSIKSSWPNASDGCCEWEGVVCETNGGDSSDAARVTMLNLSRKGLKGKFPDTVIKLDGLRCLDLSHNFLEGGLPPGLSDLTRLEILDLSHNRLFGPSVGLLAGLKSIRSVNLSGNSFTGNLSDFGSFPNLVALNISSNLFTGRLGSLDCNFLEKIRVLDISSNHITGGLEEFGNCGNAPIEKLIMDSNSLSGQLFESLHSFSSLEVLSVSTNNFSGPVSPGLGKLTNLRTLILSGNRFSGPFPDVFENLTRLEHLDVHSNHFSGSLPSTLALCSRLDVLDFRNNSLSGHIDLDFSRFPSLCTLDLGSNNFSGPLPQSLSDCPGLKYVSLARNKLTGQIPRDYANLSSLVFLSLSINKLVNLSDSLSVLSHCRNLTALILTNNFHGEMIPEDSSGPAGLSLLAVANCGLTGRIPGWLRNCPNLQVLDLSWNHLEGNVPSWIDQLGALFYLDLSNNSLTGPIPMGLNRLKGLMSPITGPAGPNTSAVIPLFVKRNQSSRGLQYNQVSSFPPSILLNNNQLNGPIWPEIGRLRELHVLDLSRNNITGTIPSSISEMVNLEILDLSFNNLRGPIPARLNRLTFLSRFSVAHNHLEGPIPTGSQFFSFPAASFEGNPGLCGKSISPCLVKSIGPGPSGPLRSARKLRRNGILGTTIGIGFGISLVMAVLLLIIWRKGGKRIPVEDVAENGPSVFSDDTFGPPKLVLFKNAPSKDLTVADLVRSTNNFNQSNIIGCGGFGLVYRADFKDGSRAAVKRLTGDCGQMDREFRAEVEALSRAQHENLVSLQGYCQYANDRLLVYSYMDNGSLDYWLHEQADPGPARLPWPVRVRIARGTARGLAYLHKEQKIIHRDIKTSNILLDENFEARLADFGLSRLLRPYDTHVTTDLVGTLGYIPPEYSETLTATFRGDIYSFGVVVLELLTGRRPVEVCKGRSCRDLVEWVRRMKSERRENEIFEESIRGKGFEEQLMEVLGVACKCIDKDPRRRPSIDEIVFVLDEIS